jgi:carbon storage regulator
MIVPGSSFRCGFAIESMKRNGGDYRPSQGDGPMLYLTRTPQESIQISDEITVTILSVKGNQVRIGIEAPANMLVLRKELHERMANEGWRSVSDGVPS